MHVIVLLRDVLKIECDHVYENAYARGGLDLQYMIIT